MIKLRNRVDEAWSDIDVQLKRRYNLIPNIVETVKGYATHEDKVLTQVTEARSNAINATNIKDQGVAENMLSGALKSLFAVAENYPQLKANENFLQLQNELVDTEDKIQSARRFYNSVVRDYNTNIQKFPNNIVAGVFKFEDREFFEIEGEEARENVQVSFDKKEGAEGGEQAEAAAPESTVSEEPKEGAPAEAPAEETAPPEPAEEPKEEATPAPAETEESEAAPEEEPKEGEQESLELKTCPKCGGELTEGHVCPVVEEPKPAEEEEEKPAEEGEAPAEEKTE